MPEPATSQPLYLRVAAELRQRLLAGLVKAGGPLPSETELMAEFNVSRTTARNAYNVLRAEGLIDSQPGRGVFVRERPPARRISSDRYRREIEQIRRHGTTSARPPETSFTHDHGITWEEYHLAKTFEVATPPDRIAEALTLPSQSMVLARHFVFHARGLPQQMSTSYLPLDLVQNTPVADPDNEPWPGGNIAQLATLGIIITRVDESVSSRMPTPTESRTLRIASGVPVLTVTRRMLAGDQPFEAAEIVIPSDRVVLDYTIALD
jgi:DNA-binding GntR family transcriptional regulator